MLNFTLGLSQNLPNREPSRFRVVYTYKNGTSQMWWFNDVNPDRDAALVKGNATGDLVNQPNVASRVLEAHYPTQPNQVNLQILSVQR